jgi:hypothetical protein
LEIVIASAVSCRFGLVELLQKCERSCCSQNCLESNALTGVVRLVMSDRMARVEAMSIFIEVLQGLTGVAGLQVS